MGFSSIKIDLTYFYSLTNADKAFELKLLTGTVADVDNLIKNLKNAWTIKDGEDVKKNAHSLISLSAVVGIPIVESWCRTIEKIFSEDRFPVEYETLINNILSVWACAFPQLKEVMTTMLMEA